MGGVSHREFLAKQRSGQKAKEVEKASFIASLKPCQSKGCKNRTKYDFCSSHYNLLKKPCKSCHTELTVLDFCKSCHQKSKLIPCEICGNLSMRKVCDDCFESKSVKCQKCGKLTLSKNGFCGVCNAEEYKSLPDCYYCNVGKSRHANGLCVKCFQIAPKCATCGNAGFGDCSKCAKMKPCKNTRCDKIAQTGNFCKSFHDKLYNCLDCKVGIHQPSRCNDCYKLFKTQPGCTLCEQPFTPDKNQDVCNRKRTFQELCALAYNVNFEHLKNFQFLIYYHLI